jgi:hypothetical protein
VSLYGTIVNLESWTSPGLSHNTGPESDLAFHFDADPDMASRNDADPDQQH